MKICWLNTCVTPYSETNPKYANSATSDFTNQLVKVLNKMGHENLLLAPSNSDSVHNLQIIEGDLQPSLGIALPNQPYLCTQTGTSLSGMLDYAWKHQDEFDIIVNVGHDWLPYYMMDKFTTPFVTLPNLCLTQKPLDDLIRQRSKQMPDKVIFFSQAQRNLLGNPENRIIYQGFDTTDFLSPGQREDFLFWAARIIPEKGLEEAIIFSQKINVPLYVAGVIHDSDYWNNINKKYKDKFKYLGVLTRNQMYSYLSRATALLQLQQKQSWAEAFGRVTAEALLSGCPVIYHDSGANKELVQICEGGIELTHENQPQEIYSNIKKIDSHRIQHLAQLHFSATSVSKKLLDVFETVRRKNKS